MGERDSAERSVPHVPLLSQLRSAGYYRLATMDANELRQIADLVNNNKRIETERRNAEKVAEVLGLCQAEAQKGLYELTYANSGLLPEVMEALRDAGLTVEDKTDRKHSRPHFSYTLCWGAQGK